jgi:hypothetical protein
VSGGQQQVSSLGARVRSRRAASEQTRARACRGFRERPASQRRLYERVTRRRAESERVGGGERVNERRTGRRVKQRVNGEKATREGLPATSQRRLHERVISRCAGERASGVGWRGSERVGGE